MNSNEIIAPAQNEVIAPAVTVETASIAHPEIAATIARLSPELKVHLISVNTGIDNSGAMRAYLGYEDNKGVRHSLNIGLIGQQLEIGNREIANAYPILRAAKNPLKELFRRQEEVGAIWVKGRLETQEGKINPTTKKPYTNLRLVPTLKNMNDAALDALFGDNVEDTSEEIGGL